MPSEELQKHTLHLRRGDFDYIGDVYAEKGVPASVVIRTIVSKFVDNIRAASTPPAETLAQVEKEISK